MFQVFTVLAAVAAPITRQFTQKQLDAYTDAIAAVYEGQQVSASAWSLAFWCFVLGVMIPTGIAVMVCEIILYRRTERRLKVLEARADDHD